MLLAALLFFLFVILFSLHEFLLYPLPLARALSLFSILFLPRSFPVPLSLFSSSSISSSTSFLHPLPLAFCSAFSLPNPSTHSTSRSPPLCPAFKKEGNTSTGRKTEQAITTTTPPPPTLHHSTIRSSPPSLHHHHSITITPSLHYSTTITLSPLLLGKFHNLGERLGSQRGAAHESSVDVRHGHQLLHVAGVDAAAVLDDDLLGHVISVLLSDD